MKNLAVVLLFALALPIISWAQETNEPGPCVPYGKACRAKGLKPGDGKFLRCVGQGAKAAKDKNCGEAIRDRIQKMRARRQSGQSTGAPPTGAPQAQAPASGTGKPQDNED